MQLIKDSYYQAESEDSYNIYITIEHMKFAYSTFQNAFNLEYYIWRRKREICT